jgi:putative ABC transport system permease protein
MRLATLAIKNVGRHKFRTALTIAGIAIAIILFTAMRTVVLSWTGGVEESQSDRIATRHKVTFILSLPKRYAEDIGKVDGVTRLNGVPQVNYNIWFGGKLASRPKEQFATIGTDPQTFLSVYNEIRVDPKQADTWKKDRRGALIGDRLANQFGWKVGEKVVLAGSIYPGDWEFIIDGIYTSDRRTVDRSGFYFHWDYVNESPRVRVKDQVGWIVTRIDRSDRSAAISKTVDAMFDVRDTQTVTSSERALYQSFLGFFTAILRAIDFVTIAILAIIVLILGNTIGMAVRERTSEYGSLRALGFGGKHLAGFVVGESLTIGLVGGVIGLFTASLLINKVLGPFIEDHAGSLIPHFRVPVTLTLLGLAIAAGLSILAAALPAYQASKLRVADALRAIE